MHETMTEPQRGSAPALDVAAVERMADDLLCASRLSTPDDLATVMAERAFRAGLGELTVFLVDLEQAHLVPLPMAAPRVRDDGVLRIEGTVAGRCFAAQQVLELDIGEAGWRQLWVPMVDGTERLGVMVLNVPAPGGRVDQRIQVACQRYAHLAAQLVTAKGTHGDAFELARRRQQMSVAAELQRSLLPPSTVATDGLVVAGVMEPCYQAGGDSFDYAVNGAAAHVAVFDAMGHGLTAASTAGVALAAYRNGRRRGLDLVASYGEVDEVLRHQFGGERFASAVVGRLELASGTFRWVNAGHPPPLLIRGGRLVKVLDTPPSTALGVPFGEPPQAPARETLEPGDRIVLYTDGVIEARTADGQQFTAERLVEFIERQSDTGTSVPETLRRLRHAIMSHQQGWLQDDATVVLCEWGRGAGEAVVPRCG